MTKKVTKKKAIVKNGRPTKYREEYCDMLYEHLKEGLSFESFGGVVKACKETMYEWTRQHKKFLDAKKDGTQAGRLFWEKAGKAGLLGRIPGFNSTVWVFSMKNRFGWRDKQPEEENVSKAQPIVVRFHDSKESIYIGDKEGFEKIDKE